MTRTKTTMVGAVSRTVRIEVMSVSQAFGCYAVIQDYRSGRRLATARTYPYGQRGNAYTAAESIAADKGWTIATEGA